MDYLELWTNSLTQCGFCSFESVLRAEETFTRVTGGMSLYASVKICLRPDERFGLSLALDDLKKERMTSEGWHNSVMFGVLDIFLVRPLRSIGPFHLTIEDVDYHEVDSWPIAFRKASRLAAETCLAQLR